MKLELQARLIDLVKEGYYTLFNPLRLPDETTDQIDDFKPNHLSFFDELYDVLAGIYRYQLGDNQLELLFDGRSHYEMYMSDWPKAFDEYVNELCTKKNFVLAGLELSVFPRCFKKNRVSPKSNEGEYFRSFRLAHL